ncbi:MAG: hypothetical protein JSU05_09895 [Bacteroidetes bacterium]|nr:hypothetical protein [Bacteroidota bacterium]
MAILSAAFIYGNLSAQELPATSEQQLENLAAASDEETEDDSYLQQLVQFTKHPINLNSTDGQELRELRLLTDLQIENFLSYRRLLGYFINIYELQSVPSWDIVTIKKVLPYITINNSVSVKEDFKTRITKGDPTLLIRYSQVLEKPKGFDRNSPGTKYSGGPQKYFVRYRYNYKNLLQYGLVGDKDAGEQFFKGAQKQGFDFYSFHLFMRKKGMVQCLALGDFTVNMGQGLIQWQSLAFGKSADVLNIKRQSTILRPYNSAGEFNFHRGAGITIQKGLMEATGFLSVRKLSANYVADTINREDYVSSFLSSGYHRTASEVADRNNLVQTTFGANVTIRSKQWHIGINGIHYQFSLPLQKRDEPYNLYALNGNIWSNLSTDYSFTYRNFHFFGEAATDKNFHTAFVSGLLISADPKVDLSLLYRNISGKFQSLNGDAFTESTYPANENGFYAGITIRPISTMRIDAYADVYQFPWLKYLADAPSSGKDYLIQLTYSPDKRTELYTRYKTETKEINQPGNNSVTNYLVGVPKQNWRSQLSVKVSPNITLRNRIELLWYNPHSSSSENGFLTFFDIFYASVKMPFSLNGRLQYFETDSYNSRLYAYENDVLYGYSIPVFYDKGFRYYLNCSYKLSKKARCWIRCSQFLYSNKNEIGSGPDIIDSNHKTDVRVQFIISL